MTFQKFPMCLYKPGDLPLAGLKLSALTVHSEDELAAALADGWKADPSEAVEVAPTSAQTDDDAAPTRAELEQQATALGIEFRSNISDATLAARIAAKLTAEGASAA
jgi:hypothetical protein